jgi:hypothetical protein
MMRKVLRRVAPVALVLSIAAAEARAQSSWRPRRLTQVTILPTTPSAALIQPTPANQGPMRWQTNRPMISSGFSMPTKPLFIGGYGGRNYGRGIRQGYVPVAPGAAEGEIKTIDLNPLR